ncbi:MAG TPA: carboxypeptidase-like regulatory domain-containing protein [Vicinamibacterales bacterium]
MTGRAKVVAGAVVLAVAGSIATTLLVCARRHKAAAPPPVKLVKTIVGAVIEQAATPRGQSPVADAEVSVADGQATGATRTNFSGLFRLTLDPGVPEGHPVTLLFTHPGYQPLSLSIVAGDQLYVARMASLHPVQQAAIVSPTVEVSGVVVRYSVRSTTTATVGTEAKTFQVVNTGNVPCDPHEHGPCSPDGKWKAAEVTVSLDAGPGNILADPRVSCIAGPCPFTKTEVEDILQAGRVIKVKALAWSDTTTFLLQGEVVLAEMADVVQKAYPIIFDQEMNFSLPAAAKGPSLEATLNGIPIIFPLPPNPDLVWTACKVSEEAGGTKQYRCALRPGYQFRQP